MPHIHTKPGQHDHTVSAFIFRADFKVPKLILHRHKKLGKYLQFGGHIELNETPWQAIIHEIREESGYDIGQLKILQPKVRIKELSGVSLHPYPVGLNTHKFNEEHFHTDIQYVFITKEEPKYDIDKGESSEIKLLTKTEVNALNDETYPMIREVANFIFDNVLDSWEAVTTKEFKV